MDHSFSHQSEIYSLLCRYTYFTFFTFSSSLYLNTFLIRFTYLKVLPLKLSSFMTGVLLTFERKSLILCPLMISFLRRCIWWKHCIKLTLAAVWASLESVFFTLLSTNQSLPTQRYQKERFPVELYFIWGRGGWHLLNPKWRQYVQFFIGTYFTFRRKIMSLQVLKFICWSLACSLWVFLVFVNFWLYGCLHLDKNYLYEWRCRLCLEKRH